MLSTAFKTALTHLSIEDKLEVYATIKDSVIPVTEYAFSELTVGQEQELLHRAKQAITAPTQGRTWTEVKQRILGV